MELGFDKSKENLTKLLMRLCIQRYFTQTRKSEGQNMDAFLEKKFIQHR